MAEACATHGVHAHVDEVFITTGSQQELGLVGKVQLDLGSAVAVELPTSLGAPFFAAGGHANTPRLRFVTVPPERIEPAVAVLSGVLTEALR